MNFKFWKHGTENEVPAYHDASARERRIAVLLDAAKTARSET